MSCWPAYRDSSSISPCFNYTPLSRSKGKGIWVDLDYLRDKLNLPTSGLAGNRYVRTQTTGVKCQSYEDLCNSPYIINLSTANSSTVAFTSTVILTQGNTWYNNDKTTSNVATENVTNIAEIGTWRILKKAWLQENHVEDKIIVANIAERCFLSSVLTIILISFIVLSYPHVPH